MRSDRQDRIAGVLTGQAFIPGDPVRRDLWAGAIQAALSGPAPSGQNGSAVSAFRFALWAVAHADGLEDGLQWPSMNAGSLERLALQAAGCGG